MDSARSKPDDRALAGTFEVGGETVRVFLPPASLFCDLAKVRDRHPGYEYTVLEVLDMVIRACSDTRLCPGSQERMVGLLKAILSTWDTRLVVNASWKGYISGLTIAYLRHIQFLDLMLSLALDPHPELSEMMERAGRKVASDWLRVPAPPAPGPLKVPAAPPAHPHVGNGLQPGPAPAGVQPHSPRVTKVARAVVMKTAHPEMTDKAVAEAVGCDPSTLSGSPEYRAAREALIADHVMRLKRARRHRGTNMDAYSDDPDE